VDGFGNRAKNALYVGTTARLGPASGRFVGQFKFPRWEGVLDCFGQVALLRDGQVECMFIYRRGKLAAWTPDGVRYGPPELTGSLATPHALEGLGEVLRRATV
jgi:hypothetical protein